MVKRQRFTSSFRFPDERVDQQRGQLSVSLAQSLENRMSATTFKNQGKRLAEYLSRVHGVKLKHGSILEAVAHLHGRVDWNTLLAAGPLDSALPLQSPTVSPEAAVSLRDKPLDQVPAADVSDLYHRAVLSALEDEHISGVNFIPSVTGVRVLWRRDGVLQHQFECTRTEMANLREHFSTVAGLTATGWSTGSFVTHSQRHGAVEISISLAPLNSPHFGNANTLILVLRRKSLEHFGITQLPVWRQGASRQSGLCLICGTTGSGKTATLDVSCKELKRQGKSVVSIGDLPEHFARDVIATVMRRDPDVRVAEELRDAESARKALKATETGCLVLGTLHAANISSVGRRLQGLGLTVTDVAARLHTVLAQKRIRTLCGHCNGAGCEHCQDTGYNGRTVVSECVHFSSPQEVERMLAGEVWWPSMLDDAVLKCQQGLTTPAEVIRLFGLEAELRLGQFPS
jgi:type II secretory ATPase GspE/PulE/Tfp pilus assembly ATPase PilB-like protein